MFKHVDLHLMQSTSISGREAANSERISKHPTGSEAETMQAGGDELAASLPPIDCWYHETWINQSVNQLSIDVDIMAPHTGAGRVSLPEIKLTCV